MYTAPVIPLATAMQHGANNVEHFSMGWGIPALAYAVSVTGSFVGLACAVQARRADASQSRRWQLLAAVSIGGVAIWLMHFIAMLGMDVADSVTRYSLGWTIASALLSVAATYAAFQVVGPRVKILRLLAGGLIMGLAVNLMHYVGMFALHIQGTISYDPMLVGASILIAVVAATAALWFTLVLQGVVLRLIAGFIMGVAVTGMHYTGMAAMRVEVEPGSAVPDGLDVFTFLFPVFVIGLIALAVPIVAVMLAGTAAEEAPEPLDQPESPGLGRRGPARVARPAVGVRAGSSRDR